MFRLIAASLAAVVLLCGCTGPGEADLPDTPAEEQEILDAVHSSANSEQGRSAEE